MKNLLSALLLASLLGGCGTAGRLAHVGRAPKLDAIDPVPAPERERSIASSGVFATSPSAPPPGRSSASLFRPGAANLFRDQRASQTGDILTIRINVADRAVVDNSTTRNRTGSENASLASLLGLQTLLQRVLPGDQDPSDLVNTTSRSQSGGQGNTSRSENISLTMSGVVTEVLPNGNLVIRGRQEMRVNYELRELVVTGIIRPQDVARDNSIQHTQIAEARVSYGGRGQLTDAQQARWGQQIYDALFPF